MRTVVSTIVEASQWSVPEGEMFDQACELLEAHFPIETVLPFIDIAEIDNDNSAGLVRLE